MFAIEINNTQSLFDVDLDRLHAVSEDTLREEGVASADVSVAIVDSETMQRLNREHLDHDYDTDVLSFLFDSSQPDSETGGGRRGRGKTIDGEVVIGGGTAARVANDFGWSIENEVILYLVHGLLHLVGYDDLTDSEKSLMRQREVFHLARWGLTPVYDEAPSANQPKDKIKNVSPGPSFGVRG